MMGLGAQRMRILLGEDLEKAPQLRNVQRTADLDAKILLGSDELDEHGLWV